MSSRGWVTLLGALMGLAGCALLPSAPDVQRTTEGLSAQDVYMNRFVAGYGSAPTYDATSAFRDDLEGIVCYLYLLQLRCVWHTSSVVNPLLGISERSLWYRVKKLKIPVRGAEDEIKPA